MPHDARLRDYIGARLRGSVTPERRPDRERVRTASPLLPERKRHFRGGEFSDDDEAMEQAAGEAAGDGADWEDDLDAWEPPIEPVTRRDHVVYALVEHALERKYYVSSLAGAVSNILTDFMPSLNPSVNTAENGRIGNKIMVVRLQVQGVFYRNMQLADGDMMRLVLIRDTQGQSAPSSWLDVFTGGGIDLHSFVRPDRRQRYQVLCDRMYDFPRILLPTSNSVDLKHFRIDINGLEDAYHFGATSFVPDRIVYRLYLASQRGSASGVEATVMMTYVDP